MKIAVAVVVGVVLLSFGHVASAAEARRQRNERCLETCNFAFDKCQGRQGSKAGGRCNIEAVRCKNACPFETIEEPAVPTERSHQRCVDDCQLIYKKCLGRAENKSGGTCAAADVRCERGCPKPPPEMVEVPPPPGSPPGTPPMMVPVVEPTARPKRGPRIEGPAGPAPVSATPVAVPSERIVPSAPSVGAAPGVRSEGAAAPSPVAAESTTAVHATPKERGFLGTLGCFFVSCEQPGSSPCLQQCGIAYDECHVRESKRGGECNTRLMNCRKDCSAAAPAAP
jgi:hypothetical protein